MPLNPPASLKFIIIPGWLCISSGLLAGTPQSISFTQIPDKLTSDAAFIVDATASSGLPVSYSIVSSGAVATVVGSVVTLAGTAGSVTVKVSQSGNGDFDPAPNVYRTFAVGLAGQRFIKVTGGGLHSAGIRADGTLWTWGYGLNGQLGDGAAVNRNSPVKVGNATNWTSVACGGSHTLAIRSDGTLWAWGSNGFGQLGDGTTINKLSPVQVGSETSWASAACGITHSLAVRTDGTLWAWGSNGSSELGDGTSTNRSSPVQVGSATNWSSVSCGSRHTLAIRMDGTLWAWGWNYYGQLGDGSKVNRTSPVQVGSATSWSSVACGNDHTLAIRTDSTLWTWGSNGSGQLGDGTTTDRTSPVQVGSAMLWSSVACGEAHTVAVRTDGTLWSWGNNLHGQLGDGTVTSRSSPVQVGSTVPWTAAVCGSAHTLALRVDGALWSWGRNLDGSLGDSTAQFSRPVRLGSETIWDSVSCGGSHTSARRSDGTLWAWGSNDYGQLGDGTTINRSIPIQVSGATNWTAVACGSEHTVARHSNGTLWAWGRNSLGQLGDGTTTHRYSPVQVGSATNWTSVACGSSHTVAIRADRTLWAWGRNSSGQLGDGTTSNRSNPVQVGSGTTWASVACGADHTAAVRIDGTLWVWGSNGSGQLGDGTTINKTSPTQVGNATTWASVACGSGHTVARSTSGLPWAWGSNFSGQLGDTTTTTRTSPVQVGGIWNAVACGGSHTMAIDWFGMAGAWGENQHGQVGDGTLTDRRSPVQVITPALTLLAGGAFHTSAVSADGTLWGWGRNSKGQLGIRDASSPGRAWPQRAQQTLSFTAPPSVVLGQPTQLNANSTSGLPVSYTVIGPAVLNGNVLTSTGTGSLTITAYQPGDGVWQHSEPISVTVSISAPEISVSGIDGSNFGSVAIYGGTKTQRFLISNLGQAPLHLDGSPRVVITGPHAADFAVISQPGSPVAAGNGNTTFDITFDPSAIGTRTAQISIANNDPDENPSLFAIQGTGNAAEMSVRSNNVPISSGDLTPSASDHTDFGSVLMSSGTLTRTFAISNSSMVPLNLTGAPKVVISGTHAADFTVIAEPVSPVREVDLQTTFAVSFYPSGTGLRTASVSIANDDPDENPYTFAIQGRGVTPEMAVSGNSLSISSGDVTPRTADHTDFGGVLVTAGTLDRLFLIQNTGTGALNLSDTPKVVISGNHAADFVVTFDPIASVPSGATTGFIVTFNPIGAGTRTASVSIANNDLDENPYTFAIQGVGLAPEISLSATSADFGDVLLSGATATRNFTISNSGTSALNLTGTPEVSISGDNAADFTVTSQPNTPLAAGGGSTILEITFNPTSLGPRGATALIANNDEDKNPVMITLQGTGVAPEMSVAGTGSLIISGDMTPDPTEGTDFGRVALLDTQDRRVFTIANQGTAALNLTGAPLVLISGAHAADFQVTVQPASMVSIGGTTTFELVFDPRQPGLRQAVVSIASDDPEEAFTFAVSGYGGLAALLPQTITFTTPSTVYPEQSPLALTAYSSSGLPVELRVVSGPATLAGNALTALSAGTVKVEATQPGGGNYKAAAAVTRTLTIKPNPTMLTLFNLNQTYDGTGKAVAALGSSLPTTITYKVAGQDTTTPPMSAGSYSVKAVSGTLTKTGKLVIAKAPLFVTPDDKRKFAGQPNPPLNSVITGFMSADTAAVITAQPVLKTTATPTSSGGVYPITSSGGTAANYIFIHRQGSLVVESFAGSYEALLVDSAPLPVGRLNVTVAASNKTFTGKIDTATETTALSITGNLTTDVIHEVTTGAATVTKSGIPYQISFTLPMYGDVQATMMRQSVLLGSSSDGRKLSMKPVLHSGSHTAVLEPAFPALDTVPAGAGWATAAISSKGVLTFTGKLGDGTSFTSAVMPDVNHAPGYRLFVQPYVKARTGSFLAGTFALFPHPSLSNRRYLEQAGLTWRKMKLPTDPSYLTDFGPVSTVLMIDPWLKPAAATKSSPAVTLAGRLGLTSGALTVTHSDTGSSSDGGLPTDLLLGPGNAFNITGTNPTRWKATLDSTNGTFTGSFELVDGAKKRQVSFSGILRQAPSVNDTLIGNGHFLLPPLAGTEQKTGEVLFQR